MDTLIQTCLEAGAALAAADRQTHLAFSNLDLLGSMVPYNRDYDRARIAYRDALQAVRQAIANKYGWRISKRTFYLSALLRGRCLMPGYVDERIPGSERWYDGFKWDRHLDCFVSPGRRSKPIAAISHGYATPEQVQAFAQETGLRAEVMRRSWSSPRHMAVLFTRKA